MKKQKIVVAGAVASAMLMGMNTVKADNITTTTDKGTGAQVGTVATDTNKTAAQTAVNQAQIEKNQAQKNVDTAKAELDSAKETEQQAQEKVAQTENKVADAEKVKAEATPEAIDQTKEDITTAESVVTDAQANQTTQEQTVADKQADVTKAQDAVNQAKADVNQAQADATKAQDTVNQAQANLDGTNVEQVTNDAKQAQATVDQDKQDLAQANNEVTDATNKVADANNEVGQAQTNVNTAQKAVNDAQADVKTATNKLNDAKTQAANQVQVVNQAQNAYDSAKQVVDNFNTIVLPDGYSITYTDDQATEAAKINAKGGEINKYKHNDADKLVKVDPGHLTDEQQKELTLWVASLLNPLRKQYVAKYSDGTTETVSNLNTVTDNSLLYARNVAKYYDENAVDGYIKWDHDAAAIDKAETLPSSLGANNFSESIAVIWAGITDMDSLKESIYNSLLGMLFYDQHSGEGHAAQLLGNDGVAVYGPNDAGQADKNYFGLSISASKVAGYSNALMLHLENYYGVKGYEYLDKDTSTLYTVPTVDALKTTADKKQQELLAAQKTQTQLNSVVDANQADLNTKNATLTNAKNDLTAAQTNLSAKQASLATAQTNL